MSLVERSYIHLDKNATSSASTLEGERVAKQDVINNFLDSIADHKANNTVSAYRNDLNQLCSFLRTDLQASGEFSWDRVTKGKLEAFVVVSLDNYAPTTVARKVASMKSFFHYLAAKGKIRQDPTEHLGSPKINKTISPRILSREELDRLLAASEAKLGYEALRDRAMLGLLRETGMRVSELMSLNINDINMDKGFVRVEGRVEDKGRELPFGQITREKIVDYIERARTYLTRKLTSQNPSESPLFVNHRGERLTRQGFWLILIGYARDARIEGLISPHTLRHTFAVQLLREGVNLRDVQALLGHANIVTTRMYVGMTDDPNGDRRVS